MWYYKKKQIKEISQFPNNSYGFVYRITITVDGKVIDYIGRKNLYNKRTVKVKTDTKRKKKEIKYKESNWNTYNSSSKELQELIQSNKAKDIKKEILEICFSELELKYKEVKHICINSCMERLDNLNKNIQIKLLRKINV